MRRDMLQIQPERDADANHRALRRCYRCGTYARPFDEVNGAIRCERCAKRAGQGSSEDEGTPDPSEVNFKV
jgi:hypothetical protein